MKSVTFLGNCGASYFNYIIRVCVRMITVSCGGGWVRVEAGRARFRVFEMGRRGAECVKVRKSENEIRETFPRDWWGFPSPMGMLYLRRHFTRFHHSSGLILYPPLLHAHLKLTTYDELLLLYDFTFVTFITFYPLLLPHLFTTFLYPPRCTDLSLQTPISWSTHTAWPFHRWKSVSEIRFFIFLSLPSSLTAPSVCWSL